MKIFSRKKDELASRRRNPEIADANFQNYRRGTTLSNFGDERHKETERQKEKSLRARRRKLSGILLIIVIVCVLGGLLLAEFSGSFGDLKSNLSKPLSSDDADRYKKIADEYFSIKPFERFDFARRGDDFAKFFVEQAPEIKTAEIARGGFLKSDLEITFRKPLAMLTLSGKTNYVDASGAVFAKNYFADPDIKIIDNSGAGSDDGAVTSMRFLQFVGQVVAQLSAQYETVDRVEIPLGAIRYVEFFLTDRAYPFKAQIDRDPLGQAADIAAMAEYLDRHQIAPAYIDCRVAGKAYWK